MVPLSIKDGLYPRVFPNLRVWPSTTNRFMSESERKFVNPSIRNQSPIFRNEGRLPKKCSLRWGWRGTKQHMDHESWGRAIRKLPLLGEMAPEPVQWQRKKGCRGGQIEQVEERSKQRCHLVFCLSNLWMMPTFRSRRKGSVGDQGVHASLQSELQWGFPARTLLESRPGAQAEHWTPPAWSGSLKAPWPWKH